MTQPPPQGPQIFMPQQMMAGVWANAASVTHSLHEFTLDFFRMDYDQAGNPLQGVVVARVNMSPLFVSQLLEALSNQWALYVEQSMPKEVNGEPNDES